MAETGERTASSDPRVLYAQVGEFLFAHGLDPSPAHFALGHRYCTGEDPTFNRLIDDTISLLGGLSPVAAAAIVAERSVELSAVGLARIVTEAQERLDKLSELIAGTGDEVEAYGVALEERAAKLARGDDPRPVVAALIDITASMINRTREIEQLLRRTGDDMRGMRASLADAQATAHRDALTGLPNRRALDVRLAAAIDNARRTRGLLSVAICDIDHFKAFNDSFGHQIGDEVIKFVAASFSRDQNRVFAARYGGEEFVILFEGIGIDEATDQVEHIRASLHARELKVTTTGQSLGRLSFSAGVAAFSPGDGPYAMLKRADTALYAAKAAGRNRVERG
ncbi:MAG: GGDEF domain-containing protein [Sphingomonas fennica]